MKPKVILLAAVTLDGKIARGPLELVDWTGREDKKFFARETKKAKVVICGHNTFKAMGKTLPGRLLLILTSSPRQRKSILGVLEFTSQTPRKILNDLKKRGFKKVIVGGGGQINTLFLKEKLINEIWLSVNPRIFGEGISLVAQKNFNLSLSLISFKKLDQNILLLKYKVDY